MSAFFVSPETIADCVALLKTYGHKRYLMADPVQLGKRLYRLNALAMIERYYDKMSEYSPLIRAYEATSASDDLVQISKSAHCLQYQCDEGESIINSPLFKALCAAQEKLDFLIMRNFNGESIHNHPRWNKCQWDRHS